jgi:hypothetical protein
MKGSASDAVASNFKLTHYPSRGAFCGSASVAPAASGQDREGNIFAAAGVSHYNSHAIAMPRLNLLCRNVAGQSRHAEAPAAVALSLD